MCVVAYGCKTSLSEADLEPIIHNEKYVQFSIARTNSDYSQFNNMLREFNLEQSYIDSVKTEIDLMITGSSSNFQKWIYGVYSGYSELTAIGILAKADNNQIVKLLTGVVYTKQNVPAVNVYYQNNCERRYNICGPWECDEHCDQRELTGDEQNMVKNRLRNKVKELQPAIGNELPKN